MALLRSYAWGKISAEMLGIILRGWDKPSREVEKIICAMNFRGELLITSPFPTLSAHRLCVQALADEINILN